MTLTTTEKVLGAIALLLIGNAIYQRKKTASVVVNTTQPGTAIELSATDREKRRIELLGLIADTDGKLQGYIATTDTKSVLTQRLEQYLLEFNNL